MFGRKHQWNHLDLNFLWLNFFTKNLISLVLRDASSCLHYFSFYQFWKVVGFFPRNLFYQVVSFIDLSYSQYFFIICLMSMELREKDNLSFISHSYGNLYFPSSQSILLVSWVKGPACDPGPWELSQVWAHRGGSKLGWMRPLRTCWKTVSLLCLVNYVEGFCVPREGLGGGQGGDARKSCLGWGGWHKGHWQGQAL